MEYRKRALEEIVSSELPSFIELIEENIDFKRWGFRMSFVGVAMSAPRVIYDSEHCRVNFEWSMSEPRDGSRPESHIMYGRLHAQNDKFMMNWKGRECYCWHDVRIGMKFLDGISPREVFEKIEWPRVMQEFIQSDVGQTASGNHRRWMTKMHNVVWEYYGEKLFELFDLRHPNLWEKYTHYLREIQRLDDDDRKSRGAQPYIEEYGATRDQIC